MGVKLLLSHGRGNRGWMFEKRVPRRIFGPKKEEVIWEWRRLHKDEVYDLYTPNIIQVIQWRRMKWAGHSACMGRGEVYTGFWWGDLRRWYHMENPGIDGRKILKWIFKRWDRRRGLVWSGSGYGQVAGSCEYGNFLTSWGTVSLSRRTLLDGFC